MPLDAVRASGSKEGSAKETHGERRGRREPKRTLSLVNIIYLIGLIAKTKLWDSGMVGLLRM